MTLSSQLCEIERVRALIDTRTAAVVIGRNEGERLERGLRAVLESLKTVVYVDSDSSDGSREVARRLGVPVVHIKEGPFTAARGRQLGMEEVLRLHPELYYIQFIDGDCLLDPGWLERAVRHLEEHPGVGAVFGRRREERVAESFYSRLLDIDWAGFPGDATYFGGDALVRVKAFRDAGLWSVELVSSEDMDVSFRIRKAGWTIERLPDEMTLHDVNMSRFGEYWRRAVRAGYGFAEVGLRHREGPGRFLIRRMLSSFLYALLLPLAALAGLLWFWPLALLVVLLYLRNLWVTARHCRRKGAALGDAVAYAFLNLISKAAMMLGSSRYFLDRALGKRGPREHLVVYRSSR